MAAKNRIRLIFLVYLMLTITGTFTFALLESFQCNTLESGRPFSSSFFGSIDTTLNWLIDDSSTISKAQKTACSLLRNGIPRVFTPAGIHGMALNLAGVLPGAVKSRLTVPAKNAIRLKLRI